MSNQNENNDHIEEDRLLDDFTFRMVQELAQLRREVYALRLDRQIRSLPRLIKRSLQRRLVKMLTPKMKHKVKSALLWWNRQNLRPIEKNLGEKTLENRPLNSQVNRKKSLLILAHSYPLKAGDYGGKFIASRVRHYQEAGFQVTVFFPSNKARGRYTKELEDPDGTKVISAPLKKIERIADQIKADQLAIHSPTPDFYSAIKNLSYEMPCHLWIHGFEARNWRDLSFNFTKEEIAKDGKRMDIMNVERQWALSEMFQRSDMTKIFVSSYMQNVAEKFAGEEAENSHVIHNLIDHEIFHYSPKSEESRFKISSIRNFGRRNYATDLLCGAILHLQDQDWFSDLEFQIIGDGYFHREDTEKIRKLRNIKIRKEFVSPKEVASVFSRSGIALLPSRWDSQGVLNGEAMGMGTVPVTNKVAAIPEFISTEEGILAKPESSLALAEGICELIENPERFIKMSKSAAVRVTEQCGPESTVKREIEIFENFYT